MKKNCEILGEGGNIVEPFPIHLVTTLIPKVQKNISFI